MVHALRRDPGENRGTLRLTMSLVAEAVPQNESVRATPALSFPDVRTLRGAALALAFLYFTAESKGTGAGIG